MVQKRQPITSMYDPNGEGVATVNTDGSVDNKDYDTVKANLGLVNDYLPRISQTTINNDETNTYAVTGTGIDTLVPPTGYIKISGFSQSLVSGGITFDEINQEIILPVDGVYNAEGWLNFRHSANTATSSVVFGIEFPENPGVIAYSPRPTAQRNSSQNKLTLISGGGTLEATAGTKLSVWIASDTSGTITVPNANLRVWFVAPSVDPVE